MISKVLTWVIKNLAGLRNVTLLLACLIPYWFAAHLFSEVNQFLRMQWIFLIRLRPEIAEDMGLIRGLSKMGLSPTIFCQNRMRVGANTPCSVYQTSWWVKLLTRYYGIPSCVIPLHSVLISWPLWFQLPAQLLPHSATATATTDFH